MKPGLVTRCIIGKIDRNRRGYEVKLNNGLEVEYSPTFQVIDIDD